VAPRFEKIALRINEIKHLRGRSPFYCSSRVKITHFTGPLNNIRKGAIADLPGEPRQGRSLMQGNVVGLVARNLVLGLGLARMMIVAFVGNVLGMHFDNPAAHAARF
jgi:hypothetical protein